jgi:hypothetical protein
MWRAYQLPSLRARNLAKQRMVPQKRCHALQPLERWGYRLGLHAQHRSPSQVWHTLCALTTSVRARTRCGTTDRRHHHVHGTTLHNAILCTLASLASSPSTVSARNSLCAADCNDNISQACSLERKRRSSIRLLSPSLAQAAGRRASMPRLQPATNCVYAIVVACLRPAFAPDALGFRIQSMISLSLSLFLSRAQVVFLKGVPRFWYFSSAHDQQARF